MATIDGEQVTPSPTPSVSPIVAIIRGEVSEGAGDGGGAITYRMRAYDTTLSQVVFWNSTSIDSLGASYLGPGPLTMIVVSSIIPHA